MTERSSQPLPRRPVWFCLSWAWIGVLASAGFGEEPDYDRWQWTQVDSVDVFRLQLPPPRSLPIPSQSALPFPARPLQRSASLEQNAREADEYTRQALQLAGRKAHYAARSKLILALQLVAGGLDGQYGTTAHAHALAAGMTAIKEARDFVPKGAQVETPPSVAELVAEHRTPVLKDAVLGDVDTENLPMVSALETYLAFAEEQFAAAVGSEIAGSMALRGLGKVYAAARNRGDEPTARYRAVMFYRSALLVYPENYMAANDLGVLLARCGRHDQAQAMVLRSLSVREHSAGWHNLAVIHQQQGQTDLAGQARHRAGAVRQAEMARHQVRQGGSHERVVWVDPGRFAQTPPVELRRGPAGEPPAVSTPDRSAADWRLLDRGGKRQ